MAGHLISASHPPEWAGGVSSMPLSVSFKLDHSILTDLGDGDRVGLRGFEGSSGSTAL